MKVVIKHEEERVFEISLQDEGTSIMVKALEADCNWQLVRIYGDLSIRPIGSIGVKSEGLDSESAPIIRSV